MTKAFDLKEALRFGWQTLKNNFPFLFLVLMVTVSVSIFSGILDEATKDQTVLSLLATLVIILMASLIELGTIKILLRFCDGQPNRIGELFSQPHLVFRYLAGAILYGLMVLVGLILFIVPGIYLALKYQFYSYGMVDRNLDIVAAFKMSARLTEGVKGELLRLIVTLVAINILGALCLFVGLIVTLPTTMLAYAFIYRKLLARSEQVGTAIPSPSPTQKALVKNKMEMSKKRNSSQGKSDTDDAAIRE